MAGRLAAAETPPVSAAFFRFVVATVCLFALTPRLEGPLPKLTRRHLFLTLLAGLFSVVTYNICFFEGLKTVSAGRASVIIAGNPVFIYLAAVALFGDRLTLPAVIGTILSFSGAILVISRGNPAAVFKGGLGWGEIFILGCVASWVAYSMVGKVITAELPPMAAVTYACLFGTLGLLVPTVMEMDVESLRAISWKAWLSIAYLGFFGSAVGFSWYYQGIQAIGPSRAGVFINFVPVSGVLLGWVILGEPVGATLVAGTGLVVTGVFLINKFR